MSSRFVHDRGCGYTYRSKLYRACTPVPNLIWSPVGSEPTKPTLPCELSVVTVPSCIRPSKRSPPPRSVDCTRTVKCSRVATWEMHWEKVVSLPRLPHWYPLSYGSALVELNLALTPLLARWCVRKSNRQVDPLAFRPSQAHVLHP
jgi:hypothetical protein